MRFESLEGRRLLAVDLISVADPELASLAQSGAGASSLQRISADGRFVVFTSNAGNLVAGDINNAQDVFLRDRLLGTTTLVSTTGTGSGNNSSFQPVISADGSTVAFTSQASNLVDNDFNNTQDVFAASVQTFNATLLLNWTGGTYDSNSFDATGTATDIDGNVIAPLTFTYFVGSDTNGTILPGAPVNAGTYTVLAEFAGVAPYAPASLTATITIDKAAATISVSGTTVTYDGTAHSASGTATGVSGEALAGLDLGDSFTNVPGGTVNWVFTDVTGNYNNASGSVEIAIDKRSVTVTADGQSKVYGEDDPALTYMITAGSLVDSDSFSGDMTRVPGENFGSYAIEKGTLALNGNYDLTFIGDQLTITKRAITVTANNQSKVYGQDDPALTYQVEGTLAFTDAFFGNLARGAGENVGSYTIEQGTLELSDNYDLSFVEAQLTITHAMLTGDATTQDALNTAKQGMLNITVSNIEGFANGENSDVFLAEAYFWITIGDQRFEFVPISVMKVSDSSIAISYRLKNSELQEALTAALEEATSGATALNAGFAMQSTNYSLSDDYLTRLFSTGN